MQTVNLMGELGEKFGKQYQTRCDNIRDIFKLIMCQQPGFKQYLVDAVDADIGFEVVAGDDALEDPEDLLLSVSDEEIFITALPAGAKGGAGKILAAAAIIAVTVATGGFGAGTAGTFGSLTAGGTATLATGIAVNLALSGLTELLAPGPETDNVDSENGSLFNGPVNTIKQGLPVPICYGELIVGGAPINVSFQTTPFQSAGWQYNSPISQYYGTSPGGGGTGTFESNVFGGTFNINNIQPFDFSEWARGGVTL